jgi:hypothetical protein
MPRLLGTVTNQETGAMYSGELEFTTDEDGLRIAVREYNVAGEWVSTTWLRPPVLITTEVK